MNQTKPTVTSLKKEIEVITKFPDQNPNPVLKISEEGKLLYTNQAGTFIKNQWGIELGDDVPIEIVSHSKLNDSSPLEMEVGNKIFSFHVVPVVEFGFVNLYATDITAAKAITKFPDQNPNPVLKISEDGKLLYTNQAGTFIKNQWGIELGDDVPIEIVSHSKLNDSSPLEMEVGNKIFSFHVVPVVEFGFVNLYATDITAARDNEHILGKLAMYFSSQVYESIFTGDLEVKIETKRKKLSVFFSDIKGFSQLTERLEPEILTDLLTNYLTEMTKIAIKHGGTVDKYIGDAIMIFFGDPKSKGHKEDAISCVEMAIEMKRALPRIKKYWKSLGVSQPIDIRIGIHTDTCTVGNFGSHDRLDYTTIGNGVNLASRLESSANINQILISEDTYLLVKNDISCRKLEPIKVKNITHPIQTYEVVGPINSNDFHNNIQAESNGFSLFIDPEELDNIKTTKETLNQALEMLEKIKNREN